MNDHASVLIVDDEEVVRHAHLRSLARTGCHAEVAENGASALEFMERRPFDVVLLDLRMPGMSGMDILKTIKQRWPDSEVVVITGYPSIETAKEAVRLGAYNYIAKPLGPDDVVRAANEAWTQKCWALRAEHNDREADDLVATQRNSQAVSH